MGSSVEFSSGKGSGGLRQGGIVTVGLGVAVLLAMVFFITRSPKAEGEPGVSAAEQTIVAQGQELKLARLEGTVEQQNVGEKMLFDAKGRPIGVAVENHDLPQNKALVDVTAPGAAEPMAHQRLDEVAAGIDHRPAQYVEQPAQPVTREELTRSMLAFSLSESASWAEKRPEGGHRNGATQEADVVRPSQTEERLVASLERMANASSGGDEEELAKGPGGKGEALYPAEKAAQPFEPGFVGDMRIGAGAGEIVRQGKFIDSVVINQLRVDLVESPVLAMVNRDFLSLDGESVLIPAGSKLLGTAGQVGNVQQSRVYIKFDRIIFPDQRSAYFPRKQIATDGIGSVGVPGDVDHHLFMQFGAAVVLGMLDGLAAAAQAPAAITAPRARDVMIGQTSNNFSKVLASVIGRYANVVPTVTVPPGTKMKIFFAEDVRLSPYRATRRM